LSRALAIRSYLIGKGVRSTRIDVRALGNKIPSGKPDRVDLKIIQR
jgi:outer membrane protein OmpA-like peptidoglycan-associated protein